MSPTAIDAARDAATQTLLAHDGTPLRLRTWPRDGATGVAVLVHGLGEHLGRYEALASVLNGAGFTVVGADLRGHGESSGPRGDLPSPDDLLLDLAAVVDHARRIQPGSLLMLGHSLGGLIASRFVAGALESPRPAWSREVDALVLSSPALDPGMSGVQKLMLAVAGRVAPHMAVGNGLDPAWVCRDAAVVQAYRADPRVHDRVTAAMAGFIVRAGLAVRALAPHWRTPTLLMWAGADRCVSPAGSAAFAAAAPRDVVTSQDFPGWSHELFNEPTKDQAFARLTGWLAQRHGS